MKRWILVVMAAVAMTAAPFRTVHAAGVRADGYPNYTDIANGDELLFWRNAAGNIGNMSGAAFKTWLSSQVAAGKNALVAMTAEPAGVNCTEGGNRGDYGLDDDADGILDAGEIDGTFYVCDGADGAGGGAATFPELTDTPGSYVGQAGKAVVVNGTEDGLEFRKDRTAGVYPDDPEYGADADGTSHLVSTTYTLSQAQAKWPQGGLDFGPLTQGDLSGNDIDILSTDTVALRQAAYDAGQALLPVMLDSNRYYITYKVRLPAHIPVFGKNKGVYVGGAEQHVTTITGNYDGIFIESYSAGNVIQDLAISPDGVPGNNQIGIVLGGDNTGPQFWSQVINCRFYNNRLAVNAISMTFGGLDRCLFRGNYQALLVDNTFDSDRGDAFVTRCEFSDTVGGNTQVVINQGSGWRITNNKFLAGATQLKIDIPVDANSFASAYLIENNSFENSTGTPIVVTSADTDYIFRVLFVGNEIYNSSATADVVSLEHIEELVWSGNTVRGQNSTSGSALVLRDIKYFNLSGSNLINAGTGLDVDTTVTDGVVDLLYNNCTTPVSGTFGSNVTVASAGGSPGFDAITGGTNTSAAMVVGSGGSLRSANGILGIPNSTTLPGTCTVGDTYMDTDAVSGQRFYLCESTNTWVLQGDGGGGGGSPGGSDGEMQYNNGGSFGGFGSYDDTNEFYTFGGDLTDAPTGNAFLFERDWSANTGSTDDFMELRSWVGQSRFELSRALGGKGAESALTAESPMGQFIWKGYDGNSWERSAFIIGTATENWSDTNRGSRFEFYTTPDGTTSSSLAVKMDQDQSVTFEGTIVTKPVSKTATSSYTLLLTPEAETYHLSCNTTTCDVTLSETGAVDGQHLTIVDVDTDTIIFNDSAGVQEVAGSFSMGQYDTISFRYVSDRWVEVSRSDN